MMDKKPHIKPYLYGMLAGFGAISLSILFFFLIYRFQGFGDAISKLTGILMPFIYGAVIAYLLKPVRHEELLTVLNETASALADREENRGAPLEDEAEDALVIRVERYVRSHIGEELSVARVAEAMHYSERHFRRQFQKAARCQISDFMTRVRIARARELLSEGLSCEETARSVGYSGERYFKNVFREVTGESVAVWQSRRKGVRT